MNLFTHLLIKKSSLEIILRFPTFRPKFIVFSKKKSSPQSDLVFPYSYLKIMVFFKKKKKKRKTRRLSHIIFQIFQKVQRAAWGSQDAVWPPLIYSINRKFIWQPLFYMVSTENSTKLLIYSKNRLKRITMNTKKISI